MPNGRFCSDWSFAVYLKQDPIYRKRLVGQVKPEHDAKMAEKNPKWQAHFLLVFFGWKF